MAPTSTSPWVVTPSEQEHYAATFRQSTSSGYVSGLLAKRLLGQSGLPTPALRAIWDLADIDKDGALNQVEFVVSFPSSRCPCAGFQKSLARTHTRTDTHTHTHTHTHAHTHTHKYTHTQTHTHTNTHTQIHTHTHTHSLSLSLSLSHTHTHTHTHIHTHTHTPTHTHTHPHPLSHTVLQVTAYAKNAAGNGYYVTPFITGMS